MDYTTSKIRNIAVLGHQGSGKTSLIESLCYATGGISTKGLVEKGNTVSAGDQLTEGSVSPKELLAVTDPNTVQQYILKEVQKVYRSQGVDINDKHVEIIARRMISQIRILDAGDTNFMPTTVVSLNG